MKKLNVSEWISVCALVITLIMLAVVGSKLEAVKRLVNPSAEQMLASPVPAADFWDNAPNY